MSEITHTGGAHAAAFSFLSVSEWKEGAVGTGVANKVGGRVWPNRQVIRANWSWVKQNGEMNRLGKGVAVSLWGKQGNWKSSKQGLSGNNKITKRGIAWQNTQDNLAGNKWKWTGINTKILMRRWAAGEEMGGEYQVREMRRLPGMWEWPDLKWQEMVMRHESKNQMKTN